MHIDVVGGGEGLSDKGGDSDDVDGAGEDASDPSRLVFWLVDSDVSFGARVGEASGVDVSLANGAAVGPGLGESSGAGADVEGGWEEPLARSGDVGESEDEGCAVGSSKVVAVSGSGKFAVDVVVDEASEDGATHLV